MSIGNYVTTPDGLGKVVYVARTYIVSLLETKYPTEKGYNRSDIKKQSRVSLKRLQKAKQFQNASLQQNRSG